VNALEVLRCAPGTPSRKKAPPAAPGEA